VCKRASDLQFKVRKDDKQAGLYRHERQLIFILHQIAI